MQKCHTEYFILGNTFSSFFPCFLFETLTLFAMKNIPPRSVSEDVSTCLLSKLQKSM